MNTDAETKFMKVSSIDAFNFTCKWRSQKHLLKIYLSCAPHDKTVNTVKSNLADEIETSNSGETENLRNLTKQSIIMKKMML